MYEVNYNGRSSCEQLLSPRRRREGKGAISVALLRPSTSLSVKQTAVPVSSEAGGGIPCRPNPAATLLVSTVLRHIESEGLL